MSGFWSKVAEVMGSKPDPNGVYVLIELDRPLRGISKSEPRKPWAKVTGISFEDAVNAYFGRSINWHTIPASFRERLELRDQSLEITHQELIGFLK